ncbi:sugar ABC transporter substrate-binding protein [Saccharothrix sp. Mg75]|uniref:sugar ABC transporter substrate-binding protein n=1 Tax=Saccharothrix sp. Mg75 TaxID=3445357 RepID=UPI003EE94DCC
MDIRRGRRPRRAFLITSAFDQKYWVAEFVQRLHGVLDRGGIDLVLKVPDRDYDSAAQAHHLRRVLARRQDYLGGFVAATEVHRLQPDLVAFCAELARPVVFMDIEPFDENRYPRGSAFVGYLSSDIGALAGRWLVGWLERSGRPAHVLVVASREHRARQVWCAQVLRAGLAGVSIEVNDRCAFQRVRAFDAVRAHVRELDGRTALDAVFCTNDEMALGAVDALRATPSPSTGGTVVVGVDGIAEARTLVDRGTSPLRATVVQDSHRLAQSAVHALVKLHEGREQVTRTILHPEVRETR